MTLQSNTQITPETVGTLKAGDVVRLHKAAGPSNKVGDLFVLADAADPHPMRICLCEYGRSDRTPAAWHASRFTYIGPDLGDGWIGWSGGENPVPGMTVQWKARDGVSGTSYCAWGWEWSATDPDRDIIAFRPAASSPSAVGVGEVDWSSGSVYDQLLTLIHDRDHALRGDERTDPTEIDETVLEIMRIATPTPAPVDWNVVGPKLVEALEPLLRSFILSAHAESREGHADWVETHSFVTNARAALAAAQPGAK